MQRWQICLRFPVALRLLCLFPVADAGEIRLLPQEILQWPDRSSPKNLASANVLAIQDAALTADNSIVIQLCVFSDSDLAANQALRSNC